MSRVGIVAMSLGGLLRPPLCAMDQRYKACVAWGAVWDYQPPAASARTHQGGADPVRSTPALACGVKTYDEALKKLEGSVSTGSRRRCNARFLLTHGTQERTGFYGRRAQAFDAIGSKDRPSASSRRKKAAHSTASATT